MIAYTRGGSRVTMSDDRPLPGGFTLDDPNAEQSNNEPPRGGSGSGAAAWRDHLDANGVDFPADATRDVLIDLWDDRG